MPSASYTARFKAFAGGDGLWMEDMPPTSITGHPYFQLPAVALLFNPPGSGKKISVTGVGVIESSFSANNVLASLSRVAIPGSWTSYYEDLPVSCLNDSAVTFPGTVRIADQWVTQNPISTVINVPRRTMADYNIVSWIWYLQRAMIPKQADSSVQGFTLAPGEAAYFYRFPRSGAHPVRMEIYISSGGNTFVATRALIPGEEAASNGNDAVFVINPAGSGVTMTIDAVYVIPEALTTATSGSPAGALSVEKIDGWNEISDVTANFDAISLDSASGASSAVLKRNAIAYRYGAGAGAIIALPAYMRVRLVPGYQGVNVTWVGIIPAFTRYGRRNSDVIRALPESRIVLEEGTGIALYFRRPNSVHGGEFGLWWEEEFVGGGGGGGNTYSRARVANA